ncbi:hypothetical protein ACLBR5_23030 [Escherichia coli]
MIPALTPPPVLAAPGSPGTLDVNQVIGDTTAVRLNVMGKKRTMPDATKSKNERTASPLLSLLAFVKRNVSILILHVTRRNARRRHFNHDCRVILPSGNSGSQ